jgi:large subunit ribosomal protein L5
VRWNDCREEEGLTEGLAVQAGAPSALKFRNETAFVTVNGINANPRPNEKRVEKMAARLKEKYHKEIKGALQKELGLENSMAVPRLEKIVLNMGLGEATQNSKMLDPLVADLASIAGQKPVTTRAKKSIAAFKVRENMPIGAMVTLRGDTMYEFLDRLISVALPRVRDFRGVSTKSFDGRGNYTLGVRDQLIFAEIDYAKVDKLKGMNITIVTSARDDNSARALLRQFGMPFRQTA